MITLTQPLIAHVCEVARVAGEAILKYYQREVDISLKADGSPVLEADLKAHNIITERLNALMPGAVIISEEDSIAYSSTGKNQNEYWLVDPLDGTKEFIAGRSEFTVNIALIFSGIPILGIIYLPALDVLYVGSKLGVFKQDSSGEHAIKTSPLSGDILKIMMSRSHGDKQKIIDFFNYPESTAFISAGSSLKFCRVAEGAADYYPRLGRTMAWDTAAGHAILLAAGGEVKQLDGEPLRYTLACFENPSFIATHSK
ncbi:MAG: 3'(2'),5'-bisphosphate nucleotidase CysQ [Gammaproteobacteria bacterium]|nr:3'(2'),5'-bisphosphate nucleotidase CysQ [Gammaproteobacteria bacterium]